MSDAGARVRLLALLLTALALGVVGVSAVLRLSGAGVDCADWPACYGQLPVLADSSPNPHFPWARLAHRIVATGALLLTLYLAWIGGRSRPRQPWGRQALALLGLMLFLSVVGIWSREPGNVGISLANLLGGLALVPMSWRIVATAGGAAAAEGLPTFAGGATPGRERSDPLLAAGIALVIATVILGALIGAGHLALDETAGGVALRWLHRGCAVIAFLSLGYAALKRPANTAARVAFLLLGLAILLGVVTVAGGFPLWAAVGHNVVAAAVLAAAVHMSL